MPAVFIFENLISIAILTLEIFYINIECIV